MNWRYSMFFPVLFLLLAAMPTAHALTLTSAHWEVDIDPATLAAMAKLPSGQQLPISSAQRKQRPRNVSQAGGRAQWQLDDGTQVAASLNGNTLTFRFKRQTPGSVSWPQVPGGAKGLILPLSEGMYIAADDSDWRRALIEEYQRIDTTLDLSLPVAGFDYGARLLSMLLVNPYNNSVTFSTSSDGIGLTVQHEFTLLDYARPYEVRIALNGVDWLAPAKQYRAWSQASGQFVSLQEKLAAVQDGDRLIGASHVYLWGERLIVPQDVKNWPALQKAIPAHWLKTLEAREAQKEEAIGGNRYAQNVLLQFIEQALELQCPGYSNEAITARKRALAERFGAMLKAPVSWGDSSSSKMIVQLQQGGLSKLWLGLPQWTAGFSAPEGIAAASKAGYLIGPYDSYDTALPEGNDQPAWLSAQMGQRAFERCGFIQQNGQRRTGFKGAGVYVNQACVRPILERRVSALQNVSHYNSWFLDVAATGMTFDDYDPTKRTSQPQDIYNRKASAKWIGDTLGVVVGSEGGHAVANQTIAFAHGAQTRGFGWTDDDMRKNVKSAYYLGRWWPAHQPSFFFKPTAVKSKYRSLYFNPATHLPLLQAALHDSVITTHHWTLDALKFSEVQAMRELLAQLYNVPTLVNLSLDTATSRIRYLKRVDEFFRPLHERLYDQALTGFAWLDNKGLIQQTQFADGTRILANFGKSAYQGETFTIASRSALAILPNGQQLRYRATR